MAKTIYTYLHNDDLNGSRIVSMDNCFCKLFEIQRSDIDFLQYFKEDLQKPALYILLNKDEGKAYIGETDAFLTRIQQHMARKEFWVEALAFTASDDSLSKTEVQYLEYLAYDKASRMNVYDLSENTQTPKAPHMSFIQRGKSEEFFKYVQFLAKFVGCDIFEQVMPKRSYTPSSLANEKESRYVYKPIKVDLDITSRDLDGRVKLQFNGITYNTKGIMGYVVVREFLKKHPNTTITQLKEIFHNGLLGRWGAWNLIEDDIEHAKNLKEETSMYRHLIDEKYILTSGDGIRFVVSNQWEKGNVLNILQIAKNEGCTFSVIK